jgi:hypothetical protein
MTKRSKKVKRRSRRGSRKRSFGNKTKRSFKLRSEMTPEQLAKAKEKDRLYNIKRKEKRKTNKAAMHLVDFYNKNNFDAVDALMSLRTPYIKALKEQN